MDPKEQAAIEALKLIEDEMVVGLGTGSTTAYFIKHLGKLIMDGELEEVYGVPTSYQARLLAIEAGVPVVGLDEVDAIDIAVDGADEVDPNMNLIKGRGAALTMEKIIEYRAGTFVVIVDETKLVERLGQRPVPIEVIPAAWRAIAEEIEVFNATAELRMAEKKDGPVITENGNFILDAKFHRIEDPLDLEIELNNIPGVVENGIFADIADIVLIGTRDGVRRMER